VPTEIVGTAQALSVGDGHGRPVTAYNRVKQGFGLVSEFGGRDKSHPYEKIVLA